MNKALVKEAEKYIRMKQMPINKYDLVAFAEKWIAEQKADIERFKGDLELYEGGACRAENHNKCKLVQQLEEENAELKKELVEKGQHLDLTEREWAKDMSKMIHYKTQVSKAKELLETFLGFAKAFSYSPSMEKFITDTEQFLKENEE